MKKIALLALFLGLALAFGVIVGQGITDIELSRVSRRGVLPAGRSE